MANLSKDKTYALFAGGANKKIISDLESLGAEVFIFPQIQSENLFDSQTELILNGLNEFDWLIFTDVYTVEFFLQNLEEKRVDLFELDSLRVLAFGESVSDRLRFAQLHADVITNSVKTSEVLRSLTEYIFDEGEFENLRILVLKEKNAGSELAEELRLLKARVLELAIYQVRVDDDANFSRLKALLRGGAIDEFILSSPLDVINLSHLFQTDNLQEALAETKLTATDKQTLQSMEEFRLPQ